MKNITNFLHIIKKLSTLFILLILTISLLTSCTKSSDKIAMNSSLRQNSYQLETHTGATDEPITVFYYLPNTWDISRPTFVVLTGINRKAEEERTNLIQAADRYNILLVVPEFTTAKYPSPIYYNLGHMVDTLNQAAVNPPESWTLSVLNTLANSINAKFYEGQANTNSQLYLFGHSAGAQFAERYLLFSDTTPYKKIVIANAGWYTLPSFNENFPYGLANTNISEEKFKANFQKPVLLLLGSKDIDPQANYLQHNAELDKQGTFRFARGQNFFHIAQIQAESLNTPLAWQIQIVDQVGHNDIKMAEAAMDILFYK